MIGQTIKFPPTPNEDEVNGLNENCYSIAIDHPTIPEKNEFINSLKPHVDSIAPKMNLPKKTIIAC